MPKLFLSFSLAFLLTIIISPFLLAQTENNSDKVNNESLINQLASENITAPDLPVDQTNNTPTNTTYEGIKQFLYNDIFSNFFRSVHNFLIATVTYLCGIAQSFFLNADLTSYTILDNKNLSYTINQLTNTIRSIATDLLLLLFVLSIWRYWTQSAWQGTGSAFSAVARLIFTTGIILAWPQIYSFQIELSNEMIKTLLSDQSGQIQFFDLIISNIINSGFAPIPLLGPTPSSLPGVAGQATYEPLASVVVILLIVLCIIFIYELLYLIVLKATQMALMTAQYVFAPFFLIFFANPVTDNISTTFLHAFVEVSLWNFIWIGLLKILIILLSANFNPLGKVLAAIGILQLMMQVPQFLSHAKISVASDFVSPHFFTKFLKDFSRFDDKIKTANEKLQNLFGMESKKPSHHPSANTSNNNNLSFANHEGNPDISTAPPTKNTNSSKNKETKTDFQSGTGSSPNSNFCSTTSMSTPGSASASNSTTANYSSGSGLAFASAISMATAIAINHPSNPSSGSAPIVPPINPNSGPPSGSPPVNPSSGPSPGTSSANPGPLGPPPIKPNSGPPSGTLPINPNSGTPLIRGPFNPNSGSGPSPKPNPSPKPSRGPTPDFSPNFMLDPDSNSAMNAKFSLDPFITSISKKPAASTLAQNDSNHLSKQINQSIKNADSGFYSPQTIYSQPNIFHAGTINPYKDKHPHNPLINSSFYHSNKAYGSVESFTGLASHNLIFSYGNPPTLMGIPPIYPSVNRN